MKRNTSTKTTISSLIVPFKQNILLLFALLLNVSYDFTNASTNQFSTPDPFVAASPSIIIGAVCSDGIALLATSHNPHHLEEEEEEEEEDGILLPSTTTTTNTNDTNNNIIPSILQRIQKLNQKGSISVLSVGLRADTWRLRNYMLAKVMKDMKTFGSDYNAADDELDDLLYAPNLVHSTSNYMSQIAFSGQVRALGCASLVAAASCNSSNNQLWLLDATGAYRVRAHALGGGSDGGDASSSSKNLNEKLCHYDFLSISSKEGLQILQDIVQECSVSSTHSNNNMECAIIDSRDGRLVRI